MRKALNSVYHWRRDSHDARDLYIAHSSAFALHSVSTLPTAVDLRPHCTPVEDQGQLGSCTGNALVGAAEYLDNVSDGRFKNLSRLFVYYEERVLEGTINDDAGAMIRDGIKVLAKKGVPSERLWPYAVRKFATRPTPAAYADAATRKIKKYARVSRSSGIDGVRQALASKYPVVFGFMVYEGFESDHVADTGELDMPVKGEQLVGGHAVLAVGYDDATARVIVRNSWGSRWGQRGYFTMPYDYVASRKLASDFWTITL